MVARCKSITLSFAKVTSLFVSIYVNDKKVVTLLFFGGSCLLGN